mgnify:FL=1
MWLAFTGFSYYLGGRALLRPGNRWRVVLIPLITLAMSGLAYLDVMVPYTIITSKSLGYIILMSIAYVLVILPVTIVLEIILLHVWAGLV